MVTSIAESLCARLRALRGTEFVNELFAFMTLRGQLHYEECVTQMEHALQCADLAQQRGLPEVAVAASLLHDVGHLIFEEADSGQGDEFQDLAHEEVGADLLVEFFRPEVTEPIRMHVVAKRYLCTIDETYHRGLSTASQRSLVVQGGKLTDGERSQLEQNASLELAVALRRIDDAGKIDDYTTPSIEAFAPQVLSGLRSEYQ